MAFMGCRYRTRLDLMRLHGGGPEPAEDSENAVLLQAHGDAHERAFLEWLRADLRDVAVELEQRLMLPVRQERLERLLVADREAL